MQKILNEIQYLNVVNFLQNMANSFVDLSPNSSKMHTATVKISVFNAKLDRLQRQTKIPYL